MRFWKQAGLKEGNYYSGITPIGYRSELQENGKRLLVVDPFTSQAVKDMYEQLIIYGYISLALKILTIPDSASNRVRKELDGFSAKIHGEKITDFPSYLIGQLSKNSNVPRDSISGEILINFAYDIITASVEAVGGRYIMIECRDAEKLIHFYEKDSFKEIARIPDNDQPMVQMIRKIQ